MAEFDVFDEAIINAKPEIVYEALLAEYSGKTNWWLPHVEARLLEGSTVDQTGALLDITVHGTTAIRFTTKTVETKKNELWRSEYVDGAFRGEGIWKLEKANGNTKLSYRWRCRPARMLLRILSPFGIIPKTHSKVMQAGFAALNEYLKK